MQVAVLIPPTHGAKDVENQPGKMLEALQPEIQGLRGEEAMLYLPVLACK
jgi:hypothetical protein